MKAQLSFNALLATLFKHLYQFTVLVKEFLRKALYTFIKYTKILNKH